MYPKAAVDVSMLVPSISHAQIPNPVKCKIPSQSPGFSSFQPKNYPLDSTKTRKNVRRCRIEAELSQEELAAGMGVEQDYVSRLERGGKNPTIVTIWHAAEALGVRSAVLFRTRSK